MTPDSDVQYGVVIPRDCQLDMLFDVLRAPGIIGALPESFLVAVRAIDRIVF